MKTLNKSKIVGVAAVSLAAVSLIGVGFASWIVEGINLPDQGQAVTVTVGTITDNRVNFEAGSENHTVAFESNGTDGAVLKGTENKQDLNFSVWYKATSTDFFKSNKLKITLTFSGDLVTLLSGQDASSKYLSLSTSASGWTKTSTSNEFEYTKTITDAVSTQETIDFTFAWGSFFGNDNPSATATTSNVTSYIEALDTLRKKTSLKGTFSAIGVAKS